MGITGTVDLLLKYTIRPQFEDLLTINNKIVGQISVEGTKLNNPILQTDNNDFYLNHNFKDGYSHVGGIFMDYRNHVNRYAPEYDFIWVYEG